MDPTRLGGKEVIKGVLLEENIGWGAFVTHAHLVRHAFGISPIRFTSSKGKFTSKSNEYYQDKNVLYYVISCIFVGPFVNMKTVN